MSVTVQYSTVLYSTVQYSTVQYSTLQCITVQYSTVQYSTVQYITVQYSTVQCHVRLTTSLSTFKSQLINKLQYLPISLSIHTSIYLSGASHYHIIF